MHTTILVGLIVGGVGQYLSAQTRTVVDVQTETKIDSVTGLSVILRRRETARRSLPKPRSHQLDIDPLRAAVLPNVSYHWQLGPSITSGVTLQGPAAYTNRTGVGTIAQGSWYPGSALFDGFHVTGGLSYNHVRHDSLNVVDRHTSIILSDPVGLVLTLGWQSDDPTLFTILTAEDDSSVTSERQERDVGMSMELGVEWVIAGQGSRAASDGGILINTSRGVYPRFQMRLYGSW